MFKIKKNKNSLVLYASRDVSSQIMGVTERDWEPVLRVPVGVDKYGVFLENVPEVSGMKYSPRGTPIPDDIYFNRGLLRVLVDYAGFDEGVYDFIVEQNLVEYTVDVVINTFAPRSKNARVLKMFLRRYFDAFAVIMEK